MNAFSFLLVTSHGLKSFISCSMSWQIIQPKDRYYSKVLTLLFPAPYQVRERKQAVLRSACIRDDRMNYQIVWCSSIEGHIQPSSKLGKCLWKLNMLLNYFGEKITSKNGDPAAVNRFPAVTRTVQASWWSRLCRAGPCSSRIAVVHRSDISLTQVYMSGEVSVELRYWCKVLTRIASATPVNDVLLLKQKKVKFSLETVKKCELSHSNLPLGL